MKWNMKKALSWFLALWMLLLIFPVQAFAEPGGAEVFLDGNTGELSNDGTQSAPASFILTVDLNGGQVNGMVAGGWTKVENSSSQWRRTVTETVAGAGYTLILNNTLGGLLSGEPYRSAYAFKGWNQSGETYTVTGDTTLTAQWQETEYTAVFRQGSKELWSVSVPYGATLWTQEETPWTGEDVVWENDQAEVRIAADGTGGQEPQSVTVTRHSVGETGRYYYTFTLEKVYYFTYGGELPALDQYTFQGWRQTGGGNGFTVLNNTAFTAQFEAVTTYVFSVYYYYQSGSRVSSLETQSVTLYETDVQEGILKFDAEIKSVPHSTGALENSLPEGVTAGDESAGMVPITVNVEEAFAGNTSATKFLALRVIYNPATITYTVEYFLQNVDDEEAYTPVGQISGQTASYGSVVQLQDRPELENVSFDGFQVSAQSREDITQGILLETGSTNVDFGQGETATIRVYYDRASYFIYFQTGTTEVQLEPLRLRYGATMPRLEDYLEQLHRTGYQAVTRDSVAWNRLNEDGELEEVPEDEQIGTMPSYDLYVVITWTPATTSLRIVYWVEGKNSPSFQNVHTEMVDSVGSEEKLTVTLTGDSPTISGLSEDVVEEGFNKLMVERYSSADYASFFSYSPEDTKESPGNVTNAQATGTGSVVDGAITGDSFQVEVSGDGTTTVNVYYTRNLYTLEFVLGRYSSMYQVATDTPGTFSESGWSDTSSINSLQFTDFGEGVTVSRTEGSYGDMTVTRTYRISDAEERDPRSPVGRLGTKQIADNTGKTYKCDVYQITARFEADIASLWPTVGNIALSSPTSVRVYISMGTDKYSYYRQIYSQESTTEGSRQSNILNVYSSMDLNVLGQYTGTVDENNPPFPQVESDNEGAGTVAHQMVAYWTDKSSRYSYYFLYEPLDTTISTSLPEVKAFNASDADNGKYQDGDLVSHDGHVYIYRNTGEFCSEQYSSAQKSGQNQPAKQGFTSAGRIFAGKSEDKGGNIYFFYNRQTYTLDIQNVNTSYAIPEELLTTEFSCLEKYQAGAKTLQELGWQWENGTVKLRYEAFLSPINEEEIIQWLTSQTGGKLEYSLGTVGESRYYFHHWYRNAQQTVTINWEDNEIQNMQSNITLYVGWFAPRYTTSYVLNGGIWKDEISYTLMTTVLDGQNVYLYYPHMGENEEAPVYWYVQTVGEDRLYVSTLHEVTVGQVLEKHAGTGHWKLQADIDTLAELPEGTVYEMGTRLVDHFYCYMGTNGLDTTNNHQVYVNVNAQVNSVLKEPQAPTRTGYQFVGWYYFDQNTTGDKVYLSSVLSSQQGLASYQEGYVYLDHVGDAHLLHEDGAGLFYYTNQIGYHFSYYHNASVVTQTRQLYAAWESTADVTATVYHLVPVESADSSSRFTPKGEEGSIPVSQDQTITIGESEYYLLRTETKKDLYNGSVLNVSGWEYLTDETGVKWLPVEATIDLELGVGTQTVEEPSQVTGNTYRMETEAQDGSYTYYAFFVYTTTGEVDYNIYAIDLAAAVSMGALVNYRDTFDRSQPPDENAPYVLRVESRTWQINDNTTIVKENAPSISGYVVYLNTTQSLQLQAQPGTNNLYFYYVKDGSKIEYTIRYYLEKDGGYSRDNMVEFTGVPAVSGEILRLDQLSDTYQLLLSQAQTYSSYFASRDPEEQALYDQYKDMTVTLYENGQCRGFSVDESGNDDLDLDYVRTLAQDYCLTDWSPTGETLVIANGVEVDVYLDRAELLLQKVSSEGVPLAGATFTLERLVISEAGDITYQGRTYRVDEGFATQTATSGADGRVVFQNLSAYVGENGDGYLYRLKETVAPAGYNRLENPLYVTAPYTVEGQVSYTVTYTVTNSGIAYLPNAGSFGGIYLIIFAGGGLMAAAVLAFALFLRRGKRT